MVALDSHYNQGPQVVQRLQNGDEQDCSVSQQSVDNVEEIQEGGTLHKELEKGISPARGAVCSALGVDKMSSSGLLVCSLIITCQRTPELQVQHLFSSHMIVSSQ